MRLKKVPLKEKIIIGIDPGTAIIGFGIIKVDARKNIIPIKHGVIRTESREKTSERLLTIYNDLKRIFKKEKPDEVALEKVFFFKNSKTALKIGEARGVIVTAAKEFGAQVFDYTPLEVKQAVSSYGRADKNQVQRMVKLILKLKEIPRPDDAADALGIAICHANFNKLKGY